MDKFTFNAQSEKQKDLADGKGYFYETDFRGYDAQIGRFHGYDLLASAYSGISPYQFAFNNPVVFNDPTGLLAAPNPTMHVVDPEIKFLKEWEKSGYYIGAGQESNGSSSEPKLGDERQGKHGREIYDGKDWTYATEDIVVSSTNTKYESEYGGVIGRADSKRYIPRKGRLLSMTGSIGKSEWMQGIDNMGVILDVTMAVPLIAELAPIMAGDPLTKLQVGFNFSTEVIGQTFTNYTFGKGYEDYDAYDMGISLLPVNFMASASLTAAFDWKPYNKDNPHLSSIYHSGNQNKSILGAGVEFAGNAPTGLFRGSLTGNPITHTPYQGRLGTYEFKNSFSERLSASYIEVISETFNKTTTTIINSSPIK